MKLFNKYSNLNYQRDNQTYLEKQAFLAAVGNMARSVGGFLTKQRSANPFNWFKAAPAATTAATPQSASGFWTRFNRARARPTGTSNHPQVTIAKPLPKYPMGVGKSLMYASPVVGFGMGYAGTRAPQQPQQYY
jgi:hypothetical protein